MNTTLQIALNPPDEEIQEYEKEGFNLASIFIQTPDGEFISNQNYKVQIVISEDGLLGLGTELIRKAMRLKEMKTLPVQESDQLIPITSSGGSQGSLGIYLANNSCELIFSVGDLGSLQKQIEQCT